MDPDVTTKALDKISYAVVVLGLVWAFFSGVVIKDQVGGSFPVLLVILRGAYVLGTFLAMRCVLLALVLLDSIRKRLYAIEEELKRGKPAESKRPDYSGVA